MPFSTTSIQTFVYPALTSNATLTFTSRTADAKCLATLPDTKSITFSNITSNQTNSTDVTPPAPVTNLKAIIRNTDSLAWSWTNPTDADFNTDLLYLNGIFLTSSPEIGRAHV